MTYKFNLLVVAFAAVAAFALAASETNTSFDPDHSGFRLADLLASEAQRS